MPRASRRHRPQLVAIDGKEMPSSQPPFLRDHPLSRSRASIAGKLRLCARMHHSDLTKRRLLAARPVFRLKKDFRCASARINTWRIIEISAAGGSDTGKSLMTTGERGRLK
jgi:hypothetical protein